MSLHRSITGALLLIGGATALLWWQAERTQAPQWLLLLLPLCALAAVLLSSQIRKRLAHLEASQHALKAELSTQREAFEREYKVRQQLEKEKLLSEERHRLATDLHDGAGSQLVSLLAAVRHSGMSSAQMEIALSEAIADLRLVMDSIDSMGSDLADALGQFRSRLEPRLKAAGLQSSWRTASLPEGLKLSPRRTLSIFRALQEALVNIIKHAQASEVQISAREAGSALEFVVQDNGRGLPPEKLPEVKLPEVKLPEEKVQEDKRAEDKGTPGQPRGRGRLNLERRMASLGGYARFQSVQPSGLAVQLIVPIPNASETNL
jgi:signal transduction histidine kinase